MTKITVTRAGGTLFDDGTDTMLEVELDHIRCVEEKHPDELGESALRMKDGLRIPCQESVKELQDLLKAAGFNS